MVNWKVVTIGLILALLLSVGFGIIAGSIGTTLGFLLAAGYIGYSAGGDYTNGTVHCAIMCVLYSIIYGALLSITGTSGYTINLGPIGMIIIVFISAIIKGVIGGVIGTFINGSNPKKDKIRA